MTDQDWLNARSGLRDADEQADAIERESGIEAMGRQDEVRGVARTLFGSLLLPVCGFGIVLIVLLWLVIDRFNLLQFG